MALVSEMPGLKVISGFRGVVDFYYWRGLAVARSWPRSPGRSRTENVKRQWAPFKQAVALFNQLSPTVRQAYTDQAQTTRLTNRDLFIRGYLAGFPKIYRT